MLSHALAERLVADRRRELQDHADRVRVARIRRTARRGLRHATRRLTT